LFVFYVHSIAEETAQNCHTSPVMQCGFRGGKKRIGNPFASDMPVAYNDCTVCQAQRYFYSSSRNTREQVFTSKELLLTRCSPQDDRAKRSFMNYILKLFDTPLIRFHATEDSSDPEITIHWINESDRQLIPLDMGEPTEENIGKWLKRRTIPGNRAFVRSFLARCGLSINRPMRIISVSKGLSLNDSYWVAEEGFEGSFDKYNLYENRFSQILAYIAFTGFGSSIRSTFGSSPEFTTNGMLPKCWRRVSGKIVLYKGGTSGASNTGNEPYSEFYASQVAEAMGIDAVSYGLSRWKGILCSTCELFTNRETAYIPIGRIVARGGMKAVAEYYRTLGPAFEKSLRDMLVFDAVVCNTDRHFGNFGLLIDSTMNRVTAPAPLFDHGNALFNYAGEEFLRSEDALDTYVQTLQPCVYDDFITTAASHMDEESREQLRHLMTFKIRKHSRYNLPDQTLKLIEGQVRKRARLLLESGR